MRSSLWPANVWCPVTAWLFLACALGGCRQEGFSIAAEKPWSSRETAARLNCTPERGHDRAPLTATRFDSECDLKIDAVRYLQSARRLGRLPEPQDRDTVGLDWSASGVTLADIGPTIRFTGFEVVSPLRGPHVLRVQLAPGREVAFCCEKLKACHSRDDCTCQADCNDE